MNPHQPKLPLSAEPGLLFKLLPEWIVDDMADFLLFGVQVNRKQELPDIKSIIRSSNMRNKMFRVMHN